MKNNDLQLRIFKMIGNDNILHFGYGGWLACLAPTWYWALVIAFTIGLIKELIDKFIRKSKFDYVEWLFTFLGGCVTAILYFLL